MSTTEFLTGKMPHLSHNTYYIHRSGVNLKPGSKYTNMKQGGHKGRSRAKWGATSDGVMS